MVSKDTHINGVVELPGSFVTGLMLKSVNTVGEMLDWLEDPANDIKDLYRCGPKTVAKAEAALATLTVVENAKPSQPENAMGIFDELRESVDTLKAGVDCPDFKGQSTAGQCSAILKTVLQGVEGATSLAVIAEMLGEELPPKARAGLTNLAAMLLIAAEMIEGE